MTVLPRRFLLPDANSKGEQNDGFQYCSLTTIVRRARAVERNDCGTRILHHSRPPARTHLASARHSVFLVCSDRRHASSLDPHGQEFEKCNAVGYCRRIHPDGLYGGDF